MEGDKTITYAYNGDGLRTSKTVNGVITNHVWDGQDMVAEMDGSGNITNKYIRGIGLIASDIGGTRNYYLYNAHGDVTSLTDATGNVVKSYEYDAFGNEKNIDANDTNPFRYSGEYFDKETATYYLRARNYNPSIGRFTTEDPVMDGLNWYTYCGGDPINAWDPSGLATLMQIIQYKAANPDEVQQIHDQDPANYINNINTYLNNKISQVETNLKMTDDDKGTHIISPWYDQNKQILYNGKMLLGPNLCWAATSSGIISLYKGEEQKDENNRMIAIAVNKYGFEKGKNGDYLFNQGGTNEDSKNAIVKECPLLIATLHTGIMSFEDIINQIDSNHLPIYVNEHEPSNNHAVAIVGYNKESQQLIINNPGEKKYMTYNYERFAKKWRGGTGYITFTLH